MTKSAGRHGLFWLALALALIFCAETIAAYVSPDAPRFWSAFVRRGVEFSLLNGLYLVWLARGIARGRSADADGADGGFPRFSDVIRAGLGFLVLAWLCFPQTTDIYLYLHYGEMQLNGINPYLVLPKDFDSPFSPMIAWQVTCSYGPVSLALFMLAAGLTTGKVAGVYLLKTLFLFIHCLNARLLWNGLKSSRCRGFLAAAYLINPVLLFEQVANAHVDILLCTFLILLASLLKRGALEWGAAATWGGVLSKTVPLIWFPLLGLAFVRERRWRGLASVILGSALVMLLLYLTLLPGPRAWLNLSNPASQWLTAGSYHNILRSLINFAGPLLPPLIVQKQAGIVSLLRSATFLLYGVYFAWTCWRLYRDKSFETSRLLVEMGWVTLVLLLFATPWYQPWYATVLLCFVALLNFDEPLFCRIALTFSVSGAVAYYLFSGVSQRVPLFIASLITVLPATFLLASHLRAEWRRRRELAPARTVIPFGGVMLGGEGFQEK